MLHSYKYEMFDALEIKTKQMKLAIYRPFIDVILSNGERKVHCFGMVDSGADYCQFPTRVMEELGLIPGAAKVGSHGIGSKGEAHMYDVALELPTMPEIQPFATATAFNENMNDDWFYFGRYVGLLGRVGFFDRFRVSFDYRQKRFDLEPYENAEASSLSDSCK